MLAIMLENVGKWREAIETLHNAAQLPVSQTGLPQGFLESRAAFLMEKYGTPTDVILRYRESIRRKILVTGDPHNGLGYFLAGIRRSGVQLFAEIREYIRPEYRTIRIIWTALAGHTSHRAS